MTTIWMGFLILLGLKSVPADGERGNPFISVDPSGAGIEFRHFSGSTAVKELIEIMGSGVALLDYDGDGKLDIYFVNGASLPGLTKTDPTQYNRLYHNEGSFRFSDVTAKARVDGSGYGMGVACADYDNDSDTDIYVTQFGSNVLYRNNGNGTFTDVTAKAGVVTGGWSTSAAFIDVDRDGDLDLYVARYVDYHIGKGPYCGEREKGRASYCLPDLFPATHDVLYANNGDGTFRDVTATTGIGSVAGNSLGVSTGDIDSDGWPDIFVANDRTSNFLFHNKGDGTFEEVGVVSGIGYSADGLARAGMGVDIGDFDHDLQPDIVVSNFEGEGLALFKNLGELFFGDVAGEQRLHEATYPYVGFGVGWIDYDNDSWLDLLLVNGHVLDDIEEYKPHIHFAQPGLLFRNRFGRLSQVDSPPGDALASPRVSRGAAFGDLDNDGRLDVVVQHHNGPPEILRNVVQGENRSVLVTLRGTRSNYDAIGARVTATVGGKRQRFEVKSARSYLSHSDPRIHIGLGQTNKIENLVISWPSGREQTVSNLAAGQGYVIQESSRGFKSFPLRTQQVSH